jgi:hypothetical protein
MEVTIREPDRSYVSKSIQLLKAPKQFRRGNVRGKMETRQSASSNSEIGEGYTRKLCYNGVRSGQTSPCTATIRSHRACTLHASSSHPGSSVLVLWEGGRCPSCVIGRFGRVSLDSSRDHPGRCSDLLEARSICLIGWRVCWNGFVLERW